MKQRGKVYKQALESLDRSKVYSLTEGLEALLGVKRSRFDETVELHLVMSLKGTKGAQSVRGTVLLPRPVTKSLKVFVLTDNESKSEEAKKAGADMVGGKEMIEQIKKDGGIDADVLIATPDFMKSIAPVAKILGPKGLMPSPKNSTVTEDILRVVGEFKAGKAEFRMDKSGVIHQAVGKASFEISDTIKNIQELVSEVTKQKPEKVKGEFIKSAYLTLTQSPSVKVKLS